MPLLLPPISPLIPSSLLIACTNITLILPCCRRPTRPPGGACTTFHNISPTSSQLLVNFVLTSPQLERMCTRVCITSFSIWTRWYSNTSTISTPPTLAQCTTWHMNTHTHQCTPHITKISLLQHTWAYLRLSSPLFSHILTSVFFRVAPLGAQHQHRVRTYFLVVSQPYIVVMKGLWCMCVYIIILS